ncbi:MAG: alpha/beta fold hydrolase [Nocardioidaceae bacterium]
METLQLDDLHLAYQVHGQGEPVVLIGGTGMPPTIWDHLLVPALTEVGYQAITFANRGVSPSDGPPAPYSVTQMAADTAHLIEHLGLDRCRLVGVSLGGFIAEELSHTRPELIDAAVLIASAGPTTAFTRARMEAERELFAACDIPESYDFIDALSSMLPPTTLQDDDTTVQNWASILRDGVSAWAGDGRHGQYEAVWAWLLDENKTDRYPHISVPTLVIGFEHDLTFPPSSGRQAAEAMPNGQFHQITGAAHGGFVIQAENNQRAILNFFSRT